MLVSGRLKRNHQLVLVACLRVILFTCYIYIFTAVVFLNVAIQGLWIHLQYGKYGITIVDFIDLLIPFGFPQPGCNRHHQDYSIFRCRESQPKPLEM